MYNLYTMNYVWNLPNLSFFFFSPLQIYTMIYTECEKETFVEEKKRRKNWRGERWGGAFLVRGGEREIERGREERGYACVATKNVFYVRLYECYFGHFSERMPAWTHEHTRKQTGCRPLKTRGDPEWVWTHPLTCVTSLVGTRQKIDPSLVDKTLQESTAWLSSNFFQKSGLFFWCKFFLYQTKSPIFWKKFELSQSVDSCSVLSTRRGSTFCSVLQCVAVCCSVPSLQHTATHCSPTSLDNPPPQQQSNSIQHSVYTHCNTLSIHTATHCNTLQHTAKQCTLQHTATHCNTLQ